MGSNMILTLGAAVLFSSFLASSNNMMTVNTETASQNEYNIAALSIAQSVIDEAKTKVFDENAPKGVSITSPTSFVNNGTLGPDLNETVPSPDILTSSGYSSMTKFDDVDDYNKYKRTVNTQRAEGYNINVTVAYASETFPDSVKSTQTYCKKMTVTVTSKFTGGPVTLSYAFIY
jgi:hypothetical protein